MSGVVYRSLILILRRSELRRRKHSMKLAAAPKTTLRAVSGDVCIGASLGLLGDAICQQWVEGANEIEPWRMFAMTSFGAMYTGALCHYVYPWYTVLVVRHFPQWFARTTFRRGLGACLIDNFIHNPVFYIPAFYIYTDVVTGRTIAEAKKHLKDEWTEVTKTCATMWIPLQLFNFTVVPPWGRVAFVNAMNLVWNIIIDFLSNRGNANVAHPAETNKGPPQVWWKYGEPWGPWHINVEISYRQP
eukprot:TRINITY_DN51967_c0_g1_i1.p1 TRINITY_DN51967_c0_g1~~TRINITY_DN51967_c0_g1_i1.p1  ORF type:complete len:245 (-),score=16.04 TRINITY_DN51967_c0_g1_i1:82-816(-)